MLLSRLSHVLWYQKTCLPQIHSQELLFFLFVLNEEQPLASGGCLLSCKHSSSYPIPSLWKSTFYLLDQKRSWCKSVEVTRAEPVALARCPWRRQRCLLMTRAWCSGSGTLWKRISFLTYFPCAFAFIGAPYGVCNYIYIFYIYIYAP